jgi:hypothetical protein
LTEHIGTLLELVLNLQLRLQLTAIRTQPRSRTLHGCAAACHYGETAEQHQPGARLSRGRAPFHQSPTNHSIATAHGSQQLRDASGALLARVAGLFGPARHVHSPRMQGVHGLRNVVRANSTGNNQSSLT